MNQLAAALRQLRTETGLSLAGLAAKTPYSKSSWERYLNGKTLPRERRWRHCAASRANRWAGAWRCGRSRRRREAGGGDADGHRGEGVGNKAGSNGSTDRLRTPTPSPTPTPAPAQRGVVTLAVLASVCAVAVTAVVLALLLIPDPRTSDPLSPTAATTATPIGPGCHGATCEGRSPMAMRCAAQPDTVARHQTATGAWMELRHSRECGTTWARTWGGRVGDRIEMSVPGRTGSVHGAQVGNAVDAESYVYTLMAVTGPGTVVRACFQPRRRPGPPQGGRSALTGPCGSCVGSLNAESQSQRRRSRLQHREVRR